MRVQSVRIRDANIVKLLGQEVPKKDIFEYLGSIMHKGEYVDEDVNYEIRVVQIGVVHQGFCAIVKSRPS